ncbi:MAG: HEAT repeat domain-containing protein [Cyanobacteria bacterium P01_E01_bin.34]
MSLQAPSCAELIRAIDAADSADAMLDAVEALAEVRSLDAIPTLIEVLGYNNPGAAVAAVDGLIQIGEPAVVPLLELMDGYNYTARSWAVRALAGIGDPRGLHILRDAAMTDFSFSVRRAAAKGLGFVRWEQMSRDEIVPAQGQALDTLLEKVRDEEWIVRYAAVVGLQELTHALIQQLQTSEPPPAVSEYGQCIEDAFNQSLQTEVQLVVRARIRLAQQEIQYLKTS